MNERKTIFSPCRRYRYTLWREWELVPDVFINPIGTDSQFVQFIGLNPSTADELQNDPTVRRCIEFAKLWGFGAMCMTNLFAFRATDPAKMKREQEHPMGPDNFMWLLKIAQEANLIVAAWGKHGTFVGQQKIVLEMLSAHKIYALGINSDGTPKHPLYLSKAVRPIPYE